MDELSEDQLRTAFTLLKAMALVDVEAVDVLLEHCELLPLVEALAEVALTLIGGFGDPAHHVDLMFTRSPCPVSNNKVDQGKGRNDVD